MTEGPLAGIRVVDLAVARAGPTCVRQLADLGADVVQVGSPTRVASFSSQGSDGANLHRNKRSILLDLTSDGGRAVLLRLVERADVLVENFRPAVKHTLRIAPETLFAVNPRLVYASISGFGQDGPYAARPGVDQIAQGLGGVMSVTGPPGTGPSRVGIAISDTAAGTLLAQGVLAALFARERTGRGQWVRTALLEAMISFMDFQAARWLIDHEVPQQVGNQHPTFVPMGTYPTADGYVNVSALGDWEAFCALIEAPELADDPRFADARSRLAHRDELDDAIAVAFRKRPSADWVELLAQLVPCGPVLAMDEVFADPQVQHLAMTARTIDAAGHAIDVLRPPLTFSETPASVRRGVPAAGAHTREVLDELGYSDAEVDDLLATGAAAVARPG
ncbi:MAG TPA: CaiB/BaiF CoA-transferase family protein [Acidimicrobiia bacterium]